MVVVELSLIKGVHVKVVEKIGNILFSNNKTCYLLCFFFFLVSDWKITDLRDLVLSLVGIVHIYHIRARHFY